MKRTIVIIALVAGIGATSFDAIRTRVKLHAAESDIQSLERTNDSLLNTLNRWERIGRGYDETIDDMKTDLHICRQFGCRTKY